MKDFKMRFKKSMIRFWKSFKSGAVRLYKTLTYNTKTKVGLAILLLFVIGAFIGPIIFPYNPLTNEVNKFAPPSAEHWLGTDNLGRDLFRQMLYGSRDVLVIALLTSIFTIIIAVAVGISSGFIGGMYDRVIQTITNLFLTIPSFPIMIIMASFFTIEEPVSFALVLSIWNWAGLSRAIRAQVISLKERDFIQICNVMGMRKSHIIFKELMPKISSYIFINFILIMRNAITASVGIMMLGLAAFEPSNWGAILLRAKDIGALLIPEATLFWLTPIIAIALFQAGAILLASGLDETLNPRLRRN
ncbi:MAG: ABC transporter permease [Bacillota bacterium]|nr:MAG: ABC transporter permease [Bacillota bacterium]